MTAQTPDVVVISGADWLLLATPLSGVLGRAGLLFLPVRTDLMRGYRARWAVRDGWLQVTSVRGVPQPLDQPPLARLRPGLVEVALETIGDRRLPAPADWVTGTLRAVRGPVRHGAEVRYTEQVDLVIEGGRVLEIRPVDGSGPGS